ncbi:MAG: serine/threonine protein kinase [Verrucomicrobia bacterium]|nr:serine/threonine protein kinase [Verrucomicrobiota bacterium]MBT7699639.1 serine/threonine protein kinase [Verrucomicrobiota bacterium]
MAPAASGLCSHCTQAVASPDAPTMAGVRDGEQDLSMPAPSSMATADAALLAGGQMQPPSRLGSLGRVGKFEIVKHLGRGGMGDVLLGIEPVTGAYVAIKTLRNELTKDPRVVKCFLAEARHMYELSHPHILKVLEVSDRQDGPFFAMPFMARGSLDRRLATGGLPAAEAIAIATQVAEGLTYAHGRGLIHRDLKSANVLLDDEGRAMIADFGLVRPFFNDSLVDGADAHPTGTPAYMSPRIAAGLAEDTRADIYAFGATLYEMLAGRPPYTGHDPMGIVQAVIDGPPASLATAKPGTPAALVAVVEWCMARELRDRYASMNDVLEDLKRLAANERPRGPHGTGARHRPVRMIAAVVTGALLLAGLIAAGILAALHFAPSPAAQSQTDNPNAQEARLLFEAGMADLAQDRRRMGTEKLRQAHDLMPGDAEIAGTLVSHLMEIGHVAPARVVLKNWLAADSANPEALRLQEQLEASEATDSRERRPGPPGEGERDRPGPRERRSSPPSRRPADRPGPDERDPPPGPPRF